MNEETIRINPCHNAYAAILHSAAWDDAAYDYVVQSLRTSLAGLGLAGACASQVVDLLASFRRTKVLTGNWVSEQTQAFRKTWANHLEQKYLRDYDLERERYFNKFVFDQVRDRRLGRVLDVGCGRGKVLSSLVSSGRAEHAVGIDAADFQDAWYQEQRQILINEAADLKYERVATEKFITWASGQESFDSVLILYVLHHAEDYWVYHLLKGLHKLLAPNGVIYVLEDSLADGVAPIEDVGHGAWWAKHCPKRTPYPLTAGYNAQVLLDFVAVQLLAGYEDVGMPCNYRRSGDWIDIFGKTGFAVTRVLNIGFPRGRDIDVPQALFELRHREEP